MSSVLVVGTVAFDSIETPHGVVDDALGGSATFFSYAASFFVRPRIQMKVLDQMTRPSLVMADTMDLWISTEHDALLELLPRLDGLVLNDSEASLLTDEKNMVKAGLAVRNLGPKFVIIKRGEY